MLGGVTRHMLPHLSGVAHLQALSWYFRWWRVAVRGGNEEIHDWLSQFAIQVILLDNVNKKTGARGYPRTNQLNLWLLKGGNARISKTYNYWMLSIFGGLSTRENICLFSKTAHFLKNVWNKIEWTVEQLLNSVFVCCEEVYWTRGGCYPRTGYNSSLPTYPHSIIVKYLIIADTEQK